MKAIVPHDRLYQAHLLQFASDAVAFRIHVGIDVMRDLSGCVAEAHTHVEGRGTNPGGAVPVRFVRTPKADVVAPARAPFDGLLEGKVLFAAK